MVSVHRALEDRGLSSKMVLQVHDELVFDAKRSELDELTPLVVELMSSSLPLSVPVEVDVGVGESWAEAH
jgi:DNA polymerase-1